MKSLILLLTLFFVIVNTNASNDLIDDTCNKIGRGEYHDTCVATLRADPRSGSVNVKGLTAIILEKGSSYADETLSQVKKLMNETKDKPTWESLKACSDLYTDIVTNEFKETVKFLDSSDYDGALKEGGIILDGGIACEDGFGKKKVKSPLTDRYKGLEVLVVIAMRIIDRILK